MTPLRIGTRRSKLAMTQAELVRLMLAANGVKAELVPLTTSGDEGATADRSPQGLKGLWIDTILDALESGEVDVAVHSAKDLPAEDEEGLVIAAVPERADPLDVMITREPGDPEPGEVVGTSSLRRQAQTLTAFPGVRVRDLRGNVDTRLRKLTEGEVDAAVLAAAGLARLGVEPANARSLTLAEMVPAPGQGCLALQCREDDFVTRAAVAPLDHEGSHLALNAERSLMWRLGGGCALPLGAHAEVHHNREKIRLVAFIAMPDGSRAIRVEVEGASAEDVAGVAATQLIDAGADQILSEVREA